MLGLTDDLIRLAALLGLAVMVIAACGLILFVCRFDLSVRRDLTGKPCPPISDEEFLARCGAGTDSTIALKVRQLIAEQSGTDAATIYPETTIYELFE